MDALAEVFELEAHLQREIDPEQGEQALLLASGAVRAYCGWNLSQETTTFQVDGDGSSLITLPTLHLTAVTAIRINGAAIPGTMRWPYQVWSNKGQIYREQGWPDHAVIEVDGTHGWDPLPALVKLCTLDVASKNITNPTGLLAAVTGSVQRTWASSSGGDPLMTALHERLLDKYSL